MDQADEDLTSAYAVDRELEFHTSEGQGQLSRQYNKIAIGPNGDEETELRLKITHHSNLLGQRVYGAVNKIRWGTYNGLPACLLVVRFRFYASKGLFRLRKADVTVCFDNFPFQKRVLSEREPPIVKVFSPKHIYGLLTQVEHEHSWGIALQCSVSVGPMNVGPELYSQSSHHWISQHNLEIAGMDEPDIDKDEPNKVIFEVDENPKSGKGVPRELFFGVIVQHNGAIQADISSSIDDRSAWPWTKDDPIILRPGVVYGSVPGGITLEFEKLTDADWNALVPYHSERQDMTQGNT